MGVGSHDYTNEAQCLHHRALEAEPPAPSLYAKLRYKHILTLALSTYTRDACSSPIVSLRDVNFAK